MGHTEPRCGGTGFRLGYKVQLQKLGPVRFGKKGREFEVQSQLWVGSSWNSPPQPPPIGDYTFS